MGVSSWIAQNWFTVLESAGIIGSLLFAGVSLRTDAKSRRITNLLTLTAHHREIWADFSRRPELARVLDERAIISARAVTEAEEIFVTTIVLHLSGVFHAVRDGEMLRPEAVRQDVREFFSLPVPHSVWRRIKAFQDHDFVSFVETALAA